MFEELINAMKKFDEKMIAANNEFETERDKATKNYKGEMLWLRTNEISQKYESEKAELVKYIRDVIKVEFDKLFKQLSDIVTAPASADFMSTLEVIRNTPNLISEYEAKSYVEKYKDNYIACRGIINELQKNNLAKNVQVIHVEGVKNKLEECYKGALDFLNSYQPGGLGTALYLSDKTSIFESTQATIGQFFNKNFVISQEQGEDYERYSY